MTAAATANLPRPALVSYLATLAAILAASFFPEQRLWGLSWYGYFDASYLLFLILALLVAGFVIFAGRNVPPPSDAGADPGKNLFPLLALLVTVASGAAFYFFRGQTHFLGDGYQLLKWLQTGIHHKPWEKGTFMVQSWIFGLLGGDSQDALPALRLVSYLAGLLLLVGVAIASARLFRGLIRRLLFLLGVATGGYMLLFFGYLESYPLFVCTVGWFCLTGLVITRRGLSRWLILAPLAVAGFFHIFAVVLIPGAVYVLLRGSPAGKWLASLPESGKALLFGGLTLVAVALFFYFYIYSYFFRFTIVPLWVDQHTIEGYWLFSGKHLLDHANQLFVLFPGVLVFIWLFGAASVRARLNRPDYLFLMIVAGSSLGLIFAINPGLGMPRDWDLFAFAGLPLVILFYYLALDPEASRAGPRLAVLGISLGLLVLGPRVATQLDPATSIALFDNLAALDRVRNSSGRFIIREYLSDQGRHREAERRRRIDNAQLPEGEWIETAHGFIIEGKLDAGVALLRRALRSNPSHHMAWANLGAAYASVGLYDSALHFLEIADARMPFNPGIIANLGGVHNALGNAGLAEKLWLESLKLKPGDMTVRRQLLGLYDRLERTNELRALLFEITAARDAPVDLLLQAADLNLGDGDHVAAAWLLERALAAGLDTAQVCERQRQYPPLKLVRCDD